MTYQGWRDTTVYFLKYCYNLLISQSRNLFHARNACYHHFVRTCSLKKSAIENNHKRAQKHFERNLKPCQNVIYTLTEVVNFSFRSTWAMGMWILLCMGEEILACFSCQDSYEGNWFFIVQFCQLGLDLNIGWYLLSVQSGRYIIEQNSKHIQHGGLVA